MKEKNERTKKKKKTKINPKLYGDELARKYKFVPSRKKSFRYEPVTCTLGSRSFIYRSVSTLSPHRARHPLAATPTQYQNTL